MHKSTPILHVREIGEDDGRPERGVLSRSRVERLGRLLDETELETPGAAGLGGGMLTVSNLRAPALFLIEEIRLDRLAWWCRCIGGRGYASLLACTPDAFAGPDGLSSGDAPLWTGHGVIVASRGLDGSPLVERSPGPLRRQLEESRAALSRRVGYEVRALAPTPGRLGRAFDGLVLREARRAGYTLFFEPGDVADVDAIEPPEPLAYHTVQAGRSPEEIRDWLRARPLARGSAKLRRLVSKPAEIIDRLVPKT